MCLRPLTCLGCTNPAEGVRPLSNLNIEVIVDEIEGYEGEIDQFMKGVAQKSCNGTCKSVSMTQAPIKLCE